MGRASHRITFWMAARENPTKPGDDDDRIGGCFDDTANDDNDDYGDDDDKVDDNCEDDDDDAGGGGDDDDDDDGGGEVDDRTYNILGPNLYGWDFLPRCKMINYVYSLNQPSYSGNGRIMTKMMISYSEIQKETGRLYKIIKDPAPL